MLARLAKLASISLALRGGMEKDAIIGALGTLAGKGAMLTAKHPIAALTAVTAVQGTKGAYQQNMQKFRGATGAGPQQMPNPPGVG